MPAYKSSSGKWYCKFYTKDWQGVQKQILKRGFRTKKEALAYEHNFKAKNKGLPSMSLQTLSDEFLSDYRVNHRNNSYLIAEANLRLHILPYLGELSVDDITPIKIRKWQTQISSEGWAQSTLFSIQTTLKLLFRFGIKYYGLPESILRMDSMGHKEIRLTFLELDEWKRLDAVIKDKHDKALFNLLFWSGMRIGEARGLSEESFDYTKGTVSIIRQYDSKLKALAPLKTPKSKRVLALPVPVLELVKEYFGSYHTVPELPFTIKAVRQIQKDFSDYCEKAGLHGLSLHSLRHSHASLLIKQGIPINAIAKRLGHANPAMTLRVYSHVYGDAEDEIAKILNGIK